ncbi:MAG: MT-A70 family methyltransferase [Rhizobiaceae bacterium]
MIWPFGDLKQFKYGVISIDFPWAYSARSAKGYEKSQEKHYKTMLLGELSAMPVSELAANDCLLLMWSTWPHLKQAMALMGELGFEYKTGGSWTKRTITGKIAFGTGHIVRSSTEPYLIGTIGKPKLVSKSERNYMETFEVEEFPTEIDSLRREHSRKPPEMREMLDRLCGDVPKCELFATEYWQGNDVWGDELGKYEVAK